MTKRWVRHWLAHRLSNERWERLKVQQTQRLQVFYFGKMAQHFSNSTWWELDSAVRNAKLFSWDLPPSRCWCGQHADSETVTYCLALPLWLRLRSCGNGANTNTIIPTCTIPGACHCIDALTLPQYCPIKHTVIHNEAARYFIIIFSPGYQMW